MYAKFVVYTLWGLASPKASFVPGMVLHFSLRPTQSLLGPLPASSISRHCG